MKLLLPLVFAISTLALAQGGFVYTDADKNLSLSATSGLLNQNPDGSSTFKLKGGVRANSAKKGISMSAAQVDGDAVTVKVGAQREAKIRHAVATGGVRVVKTTNTGGSSLTGSRADYTDHGADVLVVLTGSVHITNSNSKKRESIVIDGPHGQAILDPQQGGHAKSGLRTATMDGGVRVQIHQSTGGEVTATGSELVLNNTSVPATITLSGHVQVKGSDKSGFGSLMNAQRAVLTLDDKGNVVGTEVKG